MDQGLLQKQAPPAPTAPAGQQQLKPSEPSEPSEPSDPGVGDPATPEEQEAFERSVGAMSEVLHVNDDTSKSFMDMLQADPSMGGVVKGATLLITEVDKQIDIPEAVIMGLLPEAMDMLVEMAVTAGLMQEPGDQEAAQALGAGTEMLLEIYGADDESMTEFANAAAEKHGDKLLDVYKGVTGNG